MTGVKHSSTAALTDFARLPRVTVKMAKFVPYGTNVDTDMQRLTYVKRLLRYCQDRMFPCLSSWEEKIGTTLPPHLQEVREKPCLPPVACLILRAVGGFS